MVTLDEELRMVASDYPGREVTIVATKDLTGEVFGLLTVVRKHPEKSKYGRSQWVCDCACGNTEVVREGAQMAYGTIKSCGCLLTRKGPSSPLWRGGEVIPRWYYTTVKANAERRDIPFGLRLEEMEWQYKLQEGKCWYTRWDLQPPLKKGQERTASLDRLDSTQGYWLGNIAWVHKDINRMKTNFTNDRFIALCRAVMEGLPYERHTG